ncbi:MAG TPA: FAD-dependent oxidoreductase [Candidatus Angelobacter sp.]|nr:FAD-dependent oxidoreductase [Candidatus Angelobacter sp.]
MSKPDVIVAGAGIIGVSVALELRRRGAEVVVLEKGEPGREASPAAAGWLAFANPETPPPLRPLALASAKLFPEYVADLEESSSVKVDLRRHGTIAFLRGTEIPPHYRMLSLDELRRLEPAVDAAGRHAFFAAEGSVDPALLMQAALRSAARHGIEIRSHCAVEALAGSGSQVEVRTRAERLTAKTVIDCRGAWSGVPVKPRKGQALYLQPDCTDLLQHVVASPEVYLVPRSSGKIFAGATVEDVGYDKTVQPEVIRQLHAAAARLVPQLASATVIECWAGLRPGTPDDLPLLGATATPGLFLASGHFRNGILLAPVTARIMGDLAMGKGPSADISAFSPLRFAPIPA